jgi:hypothetical protein
MKTKNVQILFVIIFALSHLLTITPAIAQVPQKISYQAIIRNAGGELVKNGNIGMRIQILKGSEFGGSIYVETHAATTNGNGLVTIKIGEGAVVMGDFPTIDWANGPYFIKTGTDPTGGTNYASIEGTSELLSVPYALYSGSSVPVGSVIMYSGSWNFDGTGLGIGTLAGWALCNGSNGTPDLSDKFVMGTTIPSALLETGGANSYTLSTNQLPSHGHDFTTSSGGSHSHTLTINYDGSHSHTLSQYNLLVYSNTDPNYGLQSVDGHPSTHYYLASPTYPGDKTTSSTSDHNHSGSSVSNSITHMHSGTTNTTGSGSDIDNRPAFIKLAYIIKL